MQAWLIDAYRNKNSIVLWCKTADKDFYIERPFAVSIYVDIHPLSTHALRHTPHHIVWATTPLGVRKQVYEVPVPEISSFERFVLHLEQLTRFRVPFHNADIAPEQLFLYKHNLTPCAAIRIEEDAIVPDPTETEIPFSVLELQIFPAYIKDDTPIKGIRVKDKVFTGSEEEVLRQFAAHFVNADPDIITIARAFQVLPHIEQRMQLYGISIPLHRWHGGTLKYKGGKSFFTYGQVRYQDFAVRLNGRFLVDTTTFIGSTCTPEAIVELTQLSGARFQQVASRSFGAVFQASLVKNIFQRGLLVPYKQKPVEQLLSMRDMLDSDRAGHTFDPLVGFHTEVAEIDFASMYPWLIYNHNISAETIIAGEAPFESVPGTPIRISLAKKGLVPQSIKPMLDRRMHYKKHPTAVNKLRAQGLKWVLVSCYGYLRFREFKMGLASSHMAICAFAREILMESAKKAEDYNYNIVHGIVDALYVQKTGIDEDDVRSLCKEIEMASGIPMTFEGIFKWIVFLPSVNDPTRPVPTRYYGVFKSGEIKVRGIELRQRSTPRFIKQFQKECLQQMALCTTSSEIEAHIPSLYQLLRKYMHDLPRLRADVLQCSVRLSRTNYIHDIPQKRILARMQAKGIEVLPGQTVQFVYTVRGVVLPEEFTGNADTREYTKRLCRALFVLLEPFGITFKDVQSAADAQQKLTTWIGKSKSHNGR